MVTFNSLQNWNNHLDSTEFIKKYGAVDSPKLLEVVSQICAVKFHESWILELNSFEKIIHSFKPNIQNTCLQKNIFIIK